MDLVSQSNTDNENGGVDEGQQYEIVRVVTESELESEIFSVDTSGHQVFKNSFAH